METSTKLGSSLGACTTVHPVKIPPKWQQGSKRHVGKLDHILTYNGSLLSGKLKSQNCVGSDSSTENLRRSLAESVCGSNTDHADTHLFTLCPAVIAFCLAPVMSVSDADVR